MVNIRKTGLLGLLLAVLLFPNFASGFAGGTGVDVDNGTATFDPTEVTGARTWGDGSDGSITWTWNLSAGDPTFTFGNDLITAGSPLACTQIEGGTDMTSELTILGTTHGTPTGDGGDINIGDTTDGVRWNHDTQTFEVVGNGSITATSVSGSADDGSRFIQFQQNTHTNEPAFPTDADSVRLYCEKDFYGVSSGDDACFFRHTGDSGSEDRIATNDENGLLIEQITAPGDPPGPDQGSSDYTALYSTSSDDLWIHPEGGSAEQVCTSGTLGSCTNPDTAAALSGTNTDGSNLIDIYQNTTSNVPVDPDTDQTRFYCMKDTPDTTTSVTGFDSCWLRQDGDDDPGGRVLVEDEDDGVLLEKISAPGDPPGTSTHVALYAKTGTDNLYIDTDGVSEEQICTSGDISGCSASGGGATYTAQTSQLSITNTTLATPTGMSATIGIDTYIVRAELLIENLSGGNDLDIILKCTSCTVSASEYAVTGIRYDSAGGDTMGCNSGAGVTVDNSTEVDCLTGSGTKSYRISIVGYLTTDVGGTLEVQTALNSGTGSARAEPGGYLMFASDS